MSSKPRSKVVEAKHALYRQLVLEAAESVFADKGYDDAKMEEIARQAGLSLGTLYSVFEGKSAVFRAVHRAADEELLRRAAESVQGVEDPLEAVLAGIRAYAEYFLDHPDFLRMHLREGFAWSSADSGAGSRDRTQAWSQGMEMLTRACARCIRAKRFIPGDPALFARMMIASQQVQLAHWIDQGMKPARSVILREMTLHVKRSFGRVAAA